MSHGDSVVARAGGLRRHRASTPAPPVAAFEDVDRGLAGVQFHPEVLHTEHGQAVLEHFLYDVAGSRPTWTMANIIDEQVDRDPRAGRAARAICGLSGGVDSAVAAALVQRAVGDQLTCVFVDHGLLRKGEAEQVERDFVAATGVRLEVVDAAERFLDALAGVTDPEAEAQDHRPRVHPGVRGRRRARSSPTPARTATVEFLVQGTLYPDVVESGGGTGTANIKSHHNVGGLPDDLQFALVEPLRSLFKDEVRAVGERARPAAEDRVAPAVPGPGPRHPHHRRGRRASGSTMLREADAIAREELDRGRAGPRDLAVPGGAAGRRALGRRAGRRPHLRPPGRAAAGHQRGRDDRGLGAAALRRARADLDPDHQRGARGQPGRRSTSPSKPPGTIEWE